MEEPMHKHAPITLAGLLLASSCLVPPAGAATDGARSYGRQAERVTNVVRTNHDRVRLDDIACLQGFARRHARRMAAREEIWHQDLQRVLRECHMSFVGENVAVGFPDGRSVVRDGWMKSASHRENILERRFRRTAVVARRGDDGRWYACQLFGRRD